MSQESAVRGQERRGEDFLQLLQPKTLAEKLFLVRFKTDTESHLKVDLEKCKTCKDKKCIYICPAEVYKLDEKENIAISYEACLECGTCRIACEFIEWKNPKGGFGVWCCDVAHQPAQIQDIIERHAS